MAFKSVSVGLSANVGAFRQQMAAAGQAVKGFAAESGQASKAVTTGMAAASKETESLVSRLGGLRGALGGLAGVAGVGWALKLASDVEQTQVAFTGLLGSADQAKTLMGQLKDFAAKTPFELAGLADTSKMLLGVGFSADQLIPTLQTLGDVAADLGASPQQIQGAVTALGQMRGIGKVTADNLNQISNNLTGFNARAVVATGLAQQLGISVADATAMIETGGVDAETGISLILDGMAKFPGAAGAMERQSKTLGGLLSTLKDNSQQALVEGLQPLVKALEDSLGPILDQLPALLGGVAGPIGAGLADAFKGLADALTTLAPNLPAIGDAFGSLLSAVAPLLPIAGDLLNSVLAPLVPVVQALAGALEWLLNDMPGVTTAIGVMAGAFIGLKISETLTHGMLALSGAMAVLRAAMEGAATGTELFEASLGPIGIALAVAGAALGGFAVQHSGAKKEVEDFTQALKLEGDAATKALDAYIAKQIVDQNLDKIARGLGLSVDTVSQAMHGNADAIARVTALEKSGLVHHELQDKSYFKLKDAIDGTSSSLATARDVQTRTNAILGQTPGVVKPAADSYKDLATAVGNLFGPTAALKAAQDGLSTSVTAAAKAASDAADKRQRAETDALDRTRAALVTAMDARFDIEKTGLDKEHQLLLDALDKRQRAEQDAFDVEARKRKDALDDTQRTEKEGLDKQFRTEKEALDARLKLLDDENDAKKRAEDRRWGAEKDAIQLQIDSTFGAEREGWKAKLVTQEEAHQTNLDNLDTANNTQKQTEKDALADSQQTRNDALDDQLRTQKEKLDDILRDDKEHLTDKQSAEKDAEQTRYDNATAALETRRTQAKTALDNETTDLKQALKDRQVAEDTAAIDRNAKAKAAQGVHLADVQAHLKDLRLEQDQFNRDMAVIVSQGGTDVMAEVAKFGPQVVAEVAKLGPAAMTQFLEDVRQSLITGNPLKTVIGLAPAPGQKAGGGLNRAVLNADGNILRFAAGGEYHVAQIAAYGTPVRIWNEPETGGEAYIPLSPSKRQSSVPIMAQAANVMGYDLIRMANGGIIGGVGGGSVVNNNVTVTVTARVDAGIDLGVAGQVISDMVNRGITAGFDDLGRRIVVKAGRS